MARPDDFIIRRQCTPFCEAHCKYVGHHHPILIAVLNCTDKQGYNAFTKTITRFTRKGWRKDDPIEDPEYEFRYPLVHWATVLGNVMVLKWCVNQGLDLNKRWGPRSETALHRLMVCGYSAIKESSDDVLKVFKRLVRLLKVLLKSRDDNKDLPLHVAAKVLVERPATNDSHFDRIYTEMLKILVQKTCKLSMELLNYQNSDGNTVMHILAQHNKGREVLELLVQNEANYELPNSEGLTPIEIARFKDATDIIRVLYQKDQACQSMFDLSQDDTDDTGDVTVIYIDSDDDVGDTNNNVEELQGVKSDLSNADEDEPFRCLNEERSKLRRWDNSLFQESNDDSSLSISGKDRRPGNTGNVLNVKRKSSKFSQNTEHVSKKRAGNIENESVMSSRKSNVIDLTSHQKETNAITDLNPNKSTVPQDNLTELKRKLCDEHSVSGPQIKKSKVPVLQGKTTVVSPKLEIHLNMPAFKSLKSKSGNFLKVFSQGGTVGKTGLTPGISKESCETPRCTRPTPELLLIGAIHLDKESEGIVPASKVSVGQENAPKSVKKKNTPSSPELERTLPETRPDELATNVTQDEVMADISLEKANEPLASVNFTIPKPVPSPDPTTEEPKIDLSQSKALASFEEESVPHNVDGKERSFSSSAEISSAYERLEKKLSHGTSNLSIAKLHELLDFLKPAGDTAVKPVATSTSVEPHRSKKRIEDVVSNLRQRKQMAGKRNTFEGGLSKRGLSPPGPVSNASSEEEHVGEVSNDQVYVAKEQEKSSGQVLDVLSDQVTMEDSFADRPSNITPEQNTTFGNLSGQQEPASVSSTPETNGDPPSGQEFTVETSEHESPEQQTTVENASEVPQQTSCRATDDENLTTSLDQNTDSSQTTEIRQISNDPASHQPEQDSAALADDLLVIKKEVDNDNCTSRLLGSNATTSGDQSSPQVPFVRVKQEKDDDDGVGEAMSTVVQNCSTEAEPLVATSATKTAPRNQSPVRVKVEPKDVDGACSTSKVDTTVTSRAGTPVSTSTSTRSMHGTAMYQALSSVVDKFCEDIYGATTSAPSRTVDKTDQNYDSLSLRMIDQICEEWYGISPGPKKTAENQGGTSSESVPGHSNLPQSRKPDAVTSSQDKVVVCQGTTPSHTLNNTRPSQSSAQGQAVSQSSQVAQQRPLQALRNKPSQPGVNDYGTGQDRSHLQSPAQLPVQGMSRATTHGQAQTPQAFIQRPQLRMQQTQPLQTGQPQGLVQQIFTQADTLTLQMRREIPREQISTLTQGKTSSLGQVPTQPGHQHVRHPVYRQQAQFVRQPHPGTYRNIAPVQQSTVVSQGDFILLRHASGNRPLTHIGIINQSNCPRTVPVNMNRPQIAMGRDNAAMNQAVVANTQNLRRYISPAQNVNQSRTDGQRMLFLQSPNPAFNSAYHSATLQPRPGNTSVPPYMVARPSNPSARELTLDQLKRRLLTENRTPRLRTSHVSRQPARTSMQIQPNYLDPSARLMPGDGRSTTSYVIGPDVATALANKISIGHTDRTKAASPSMDTIMDSSGNVSPGTGPDGNSREMYITEPTGSRGPTPKSDQTPPLPPATTPPADDQSKQATQTRGRDTNKQEESEDKGHELNRFSDAENAKDIFADLSGMKEVLEKLSNIVPKEELLLLLEKTKTDLKEKIDKWTNEYEAAERCERQKNLDLRKLEEKIEREQENMKKLCENADACRKERLEASQKKTLFQNKIAKENEKIPKINECIDMFS